MQRNDEVEFFVIGVRCIGYIRSISDNVVKINSLIGEYFRNIKDVRLIDRGSR